MENEVENSDEMEEKEPSLLPQKPSPVPPAGRESEQKSPPPAPLKEGENEVGEPPQPLQRRRE